jgi:4a-hydroxytetrahydrobiopterin dehydratase
MTLVREVVAGPGDIHMWSMRRCATAVRAQFSGRLGRRLTIEESSMPNTLAAKSCTPCRGGIPPLTTLEAQTYLAQAPAWDLLDDGRKIQRTYRFKNFREALGFVQRAGELAEAEGHHPDIAFGWGYATVSLQTKKIRGLHENDFIMAAKLDGLSSH